MKQTPSIFTLQGLLAYLRTGPQTTNDGVTWAPVRPQTSFGIKVRIRAAWLVLTGRADVIVW